MARIKNARRSPFIKASSPDATLTSWSNALRSGDFVVKSEVIWKSYEPIVTFRNITSVSYTIKSNVASYCLIGGLLFWDWFCTVDVGGTFLVAGPPWGDIFDPACLISAPNDVIDPTPYINTVSLTSTLASSIPTGITYSIFSDALAFTSGITTGYREYDSSLKGMGNLFYNPTDRRFEIPSNTLLNIKPIVGGRINTIYASGCMRAIGAQNQLI